MKKDLLKLTDLSRDEILHILDVADQLKYNQKHGIPHKILEGKTLGMIFQKSSTRTRVSFEVGMFQLGGKALFLSSNDMQIGRGIVNRGGNIVITLAVLTHIITSNKKQNHPRKPKGDKH